MKQLELNLKERLLIVEPKDGNLAYDVQHDENGPHPLKFICKGPDFTEEIAKAFSQSLFERFYKDFKVEQNDYTTHYYAGAYTLNSALESFISAIEAQGYYWGENPHGEEPQDIPDLGEFTVMMRRKHKEWKEAESRTFNPEKTLIFKIIS